MKSLWMAQAQSTTDQRPFPSLGFIIGLLLGMGTMLVAITIFQYKT